MDGLSGFDPPKPTEDEIQKYRASMDQVWASVRQQLPRIEGVKGRILGVFEATSEEKRSQIKLTLDTSDLIAVMHALNYTSMVALAKQHGVAD